MCFGGGNDGSGEARDARLRAEADERYRKSAIIAGQKRIDTNFSQFDDGYFDNFREDYKSNYFPQLETQFNDANDKLTAGLAGRGMLESSVGASRLGDLQKTYNDERSSIGGKAFDAAQDIRARIENQKSNLYSYNTAAADPQGVAARARSEATALVAPQAFSPLGQVFASALQPIAAFVSADRNSVSPQLGFNQTSGGYSSPTSSSGRVIS